MRPTGRPWRPARSERGAATVLVVALLGVLLLLGSALGVVTAMFAAHRTAQAAADLAALAGAEALTHGADGCLAAAGLAEANGAVLTGCTITDRDVEVRVTVAGPRMLGQTGDLQAAARAGPDRS